MELQASLPDLERQGIVPLAISYDPVADLARFAQRRGITFHLLSDQGSQVIRRLGLLNRHIREQHAFYDVPVQPHHQGSSYPGLFVLDEQGIVVEKHFEQSYRVRPSPALLLEEVPGGRSTRSGVAARAGGALLAVEAQVDRPVYHVYEQHRLRLRFQLTPGVHVYAQPVPEGYVPLTVELEPLEGLVLGTVQLPQPRPFRVQGLAEQFLVHEGRFTARLPFRLEKLHQAVELRVRVGYQACTHRECFPPAVVELTLPLAGADLVRE